MKKKIQFNSDGLVLVGNLYTPENFDQSKKYPTILVGGSWTTVKEQMSGLYAEELAKQGFITLAIDPRYFGESEGQPKFWENPTAKIADFKNAITFLETVQGVDTNNIFLTAVCASSGYMANVAAQDKRVKGFSTIAAWLHDSEAVKLIYGGEEGVQTKIKQAQEAKKAFAENGTIKYIPSISTSDNTAAMFGEYDYYLNANRGAVPQWCADKFAVMSWEDWLTFDPMVVAKNIQLPTLMIHSDGAVLGDYVKKFFNDIPHDNKVLHWTEGTQFDFYDQPKQVSESVAAINVFFKNHIN
ncbi:MAG: alpha/beta hydrolase [Bacteroidia bacterium]